VSNRAHNWIVSEWPAPARVKTCVTTRSGGISQPPYASFNLAGHVGDEPAAVATNRRRLASQLGCQQAWLEQVHGVAVVEANPSQVLEADASWTATANLACAVLTADCLPVLFCDRAGSRVAAAHAGWRGLANGVLEATLQALEVPADQVLVWLGPAIGPDSFEVGPEVREVFVTQNLETVQAFRPSANVGKYMADLYQLARIRLAACGVHAVYGGGLCTYNDARFYSYRRSAQTGRFASLIWLSS
jgi:polyphenol oxidase